MRAHGIGITCVGVVLFAIASAAPAVAQTTQTSPGKPAPAASSTLHTTATKPAAAPQAAPTGLIDINSASSTDLDALPGVGKSRAAAIIKNRPYSGKDDLVNKHVLPKSVYDGIKDKIIAKKA